MEASSTSSFCHAFEWLPNIFEGLEEDACGLPGSQKGSRGQVVIDTAPAPQTDHLGGVRSSRPDAELAGSRVGR